MGINLFAIAITKFLLNSVLGKRGTFSEPGIIPIPRVHIKAFDSIGILNDIFNNWAVTEWFVIVLVLVVWFVFYKTRWGLHLRAVGQFPMAAQTAGINVSAMKYEAIAISGLIGGLAGAHLSLGYSALFTENMTNSRGFMGVAAMFFGNADPVWTSVGCLVFGLADSVGNRLQAHGLPSQLVLLMPYVVTVVVLAVSMASKVFTGQRRKSSLTTVSA
jgi:general nucleoside transport system permease protein